MMKIECFVCNPFRENSFILSDSSGECIIVDPGCENQEEQKVLTDYIDGNGLRPVLLISTHGHVDHLLGLASLRENYHIPSMMHQDDVFLLENAVSQGAFFGLEVDTPPYPDSFLSEGERIEFGESFLRVYHVPGHSPGSVALHSEEDKFVIVGDVLFLGSIGRTDLPGGDHETLLRSIKEKLLILSPETVVHPGHGPATTIGDEIVSNPFLF